MPGARLGSPASVWASVSTTQNSAAWSQLRGGVGQGRGGWRLPGVGLPFLPTSFQGIGMSTFSSSLNPTPDFSILCTTAPPSALLVPGSSSQCQFLHPTPPPSSPSVLITLVIIPPLRSPDVPCLTITHCYHYRNTCTAKHSCKPFLYMISFKFPDNTIGRC